MPAAPDLVSFPIALRQDHRLFFTREVFAVGNPTLASVLTPREPGENVRALVFYDAGLAAAFPGFGEKVQLWFAAHAERVCLAAAPLAVPGGEATKHGLAQVESAWAAMNAAGLCRHSYVVAVGGGAVLDMVGFAAATAHRGIPLVRLPSTSLSQADGGVGVKNGVNFFGKKNWIGSFGVPHAIVNDLAFLEGLAPPERRAGLIEAVKVSLIRDAAFFEFIASHAAALSRFEREPYESVIRESARQHVEHIATAGDPFESGSARPLDFGHWAAHKLEQLSGFRASHGAAVAVGLALDVTYSRRAGLLPAPWAERILDVVARLGFTLFSPLLATRDAAGRPRVLEGLDEFREHMGGRLTIPLLRAPGDRVDVHEIEPALVEAALGELQDRDGR
ncbi:MAG: 3-dehydroquinate synthase [Verrucomicrobia bacterium]|nr:3-dehydroquinate synthase [Verrucomicrobiota bacterium]